MKQTARIFQYSPRRMAELLESGEVPGGMKIGREWRIAARTVYQFVDGWEKRSGEDSTPAADRTSR